MVGQNAEHEKTREETSSKHPHKKGAAQAAEGRIRELKSSNATVSPAAAAANNSAAATAARQRDNQRALDEKRKERWKSAERSEKRERERSTIQSMDPWLYRLDFRIFAYVLAESRTHSLWQLPVGASVGAGRSRGMWSVQRAYSPGSGAFCFVFPSSRSARAFRRHPDLAPPMGCGCPWRTA